MALNITPLKVAAGCAAQAAAFGLLARQRGAKTQI
jgi:hypothetical protein